MKGLSGKRVEIPSMEEITQERKRLSYRRRYKRVLKSTAYALVVVAAIAVLLATNLPVSYTHLTLPTNREV